MRFLYDLSSAAFEFETKKRGGRRGHKNWTSKENRSGALNDENEDFFDDEFDYDNYDHQDPNAGGGPGAGTGSRTGPGGDPGAGASAIFV